MEVLETARVDAFCQNDIVVPANKRHDTLVVVWEGIEQRLEDLQVRFRELLVDNVTREA